MKNLEKLIEQVNGSMSIEGMPLTESDKERIRHYAGDDAKVEEAVAELVKKHTSSKEASS
ncbi:hypothetical protein [Paenibacillus senegalimassiliensis]|uniref:hypothetical protein n=1 Tax=Paenibacillus senegalimassiliensis TaxID=1737426 RepID=UPI000ACB335E|nr:hypothetical protein [Paenibacillus senegalimassiliensis]